MMTSENLHDESGPSRHDQLTAGSSSIIARSWNAIAEVFASPSTSNGLALPTGRLPRNPEGLRQRSTRADRIPETEVDVAGRRPSIRDYHSINAVPPQVRVPKKIATPIQVEGKVWFANERTWISYLDVSILLGTFSLALFNGSKDQIARNFAYAYAAISVGIMVYGYIVYQHRITMIKQRYPGHFDQILGPVVICVFLFVAVLTNFVIRVKELNRNKLPDPPM